MIIAPNEWNNNNDKGGGGGGGNGENSYINVYHNVTDNRDENIIDKSTVNYSKRTFS